MYNTFLFITFVALINQNNYVIMGEKEELEDEIRRIKVNLSDYLRVSLSFNVSKEEKERVIDQFLDDILYRKKKIIKLEKNK